MDSCNICPYWACVTPNDSNWVLHIKGTFQAMTIYFSLVFIPRRSSTVGQKAAGGMYG